MKNAVFILAALGGFCEFAYGQIGPNTQAGQAFAYSHFAATAIDTNLAGSNMNWDYSGILADTSLRRSLVYRLPSINELIVDPNVEFVEENLFAEVHFYKRNADSLYQIGQLDPVQFFHTNYDNPATYFLLPEDANLTPQVDTFQFPFEINGTAATVVGVQKWQIIGDGTLTTPFGNYTNVRKTRRIRDFYYHFQGVQVLHNQEYEYTYFDAGFTKPLITMRFNDFSNLMTAFVYEEENTLSLQEPSFAGLRVHPNPATDYLEFSETVQAYTLLSADGTVHMQGVNEGKVDVRSLPPGTYFIRMQTSIGPVLEQLIVQ